MKKTLSIMLTICLLFGILSALPLHASALSPPYVSAVSIAGSAERTVLIGDEIELTASIGAEGLSSAFVLWETDNADVLSVNGGELSVSGDPPQSKIGRASCRERV